ncbi:hypothetical protein DEJ39_03745 [Bacteroidetes bacterium SCGC AAA795-G10]|nr:hypothetical protein DEJ39_03745 [Bacteroidetes bacterium SCGC AAA795-G10]
MKHRFFLLCTFLLSCSSEYSKEKQIIEKSVQVYGWNQKEFSIVFDFRDYRYKLTRKPDFFSYQRSTVKKGVLVRDVMTSNSKLKRYLDENPFILSDSLTDIYSNSLNSVMYFFQLPRPLNDPAVIANYNGEKAISNKVYWTLKVKFQEKDGGKDFQDEFRYWIDPKSGYIDYLAYSYLTDGGGTRFRKAKNVRENNGFIFQDYTNFRPVKKFTPLDSLPILYEKGKLILVSEIENKNIKVLNR